MLACGLLSLSHLNSPVEGIKWKYPGGCFQQGQTTGLFVL